MTCGALSASRLRAVPLFESKRPNVTQPYQIYLLRRWPVSGSRPVIWRALLQCVSSGERQGFEDLEALFAHIRDLVDRENPEGVTRHNGDRGPIDAAG